MNLLESLRQFPDFASVPDEQLQWLIDRSEETTYPKETVLYKPNQPADHLMLLLEGRVRIDNGTSNPSDEIHLYNPHSILGVLPFSRMTSFPSRFVTHTPVTMLRMHREHLLPMIQNCYELTAALVQQMTSRVRYFTKQTQQTDKLASLGRLSAGLAHELNNPVAAVVRSVETLSDHMRATPDAFKAILHLKLSDEQIDAVNELIFGKIGTPVKTLSLLERSSLEDELTDWLDDHAVDDALDLAGPLVDFGFSTGDLDWILERIGDENLGGVMNWLIDNLVTEKLVTDISEASKRIALLVGSIKNYTHMDRGTGKETVQLAEGIRSTLVLLDHKLRSKHIAVTVELPNDLPTVCGWPGELNQVWTNLIDNAIDALPDGGAITISSEPDREFVLTKIIDNGSGIADDVLDKIFDPFFTTKGIGKGTGLGLDIVQGIVQHHNGSIKVESKPGHTEFSVCLPVAG